MTDGFNMRALLLLGLSVQFNSERPTFDSRLHDISWKFIKDRENCQRNCSKISTGCCPHFVDLPDFCILLKKPPRAKGRPPLIWLPSFYCQKLDKLLQHPGSGHHTKSNWIWSRKGRIWLEASSTLPIHLVPGILRKVSQSSFHIFYLRFRALNLCQLSFIL